MTITTSLARATSAVRLSSPGNAARAPDGSLVPYHYVAAHRGPQQELVIRDYRANVLIGTQNLGGILKSRPMCSDWSGDPVLCMGQGADDGLWNNIRSRGTWSGWSRVRGANGR